MALLTLANYKASRGLTGVTTYDTELQAFLDEAHAILRRYCGRDLTNGFESATRTEEYDEDTPFIYTNEWPVTSITSIKPVDVDNVVGDALATTGYRLDAASGKITLNGAASGRLGGTYGDGQSWGWSDIWGRVQVVYVSTAPAADVAGRIAKLVDVLYTFAGAPDGIASHSLGPWTVSYKTMDEGITAVLATCRMLRRSA